MKIVAESIQELNEGAWGHGPLDNDGASDWKWKFGDMILKELRAKIERGLKAKDSPVNTEYLYYAIGMWEFFKNRLKTNYSFFKDDEIRNMDNLTKKAAEKLLELNYSKYYDNPEEVKIYLENYINNV